MGTDDFLHGPSSTNSIDVQGLWFSLLERFFYMLYTVHRSSDEVSPIGMGKGEIVDRLDI